MVERAGVRGENNPDPVKKLREAIAHVSLPCFFFKTKIILIF